jgi:hypothetical protein
MEIRIFTIRQIFQNIFGRNYRQLSPIDSLSPLPEEKVASHPNIREFSSGSTERRRNQELLCREKIVRCDIVAIYIRDHTQN